MPLYQPFPAMTFPPQGRPTLATGVPVMQTSYAAQTTVYYTPCVGNLLPIYDGLNVIPTVFAELSQATTDSTKSPAAVTTNSNYDLFGWVDSGTVRATRGPAWSSATTRGTGAGTTELVRVNGLLLNAVAITNGPAAQRGTYLGTIRSNGSSQIDYIFGAAGAGGVAASFGVWSMYNRVCVATMVTDTTDTWVHNTVAWRAVNNSATNRISAVRGLDEDGIEAAYTGHYYCNASATAVVGIGLDSTTAFVGTTGNNSSTTTILTMPGRYSGLMGLGFHFVSAVEFSSHTNGVNGNGDQGVAFTQSGLHGIFWQ